LRADIEAIEMNIQVLQEGLQREQRYLEQRDTEPRSAHPAQSSHDANLQLENAEITRNIALFEESIVREQAKLEQLHDATDELARLERFVSGENPLTTNDLDGEDDSDLQAIREATSKIGAYVTKWSYNILRPMSVFSKTYASASAFLSEYDTVASLYRQGLAYWPTDIDNLDAALSTYDSANHTGILSRLNVFKKTLEQIESKYDEAIEKFRSNYNSDDGVVGHLVTGDFLEQFQQLQLRLEELRRGLVARSGEAGITSRINQAADQCTVEDPALIQTVISNILAVLPSIGPLPKADGATSYNYYDIYGWLNGKQHLRRGHTPNLSVIWEDFIDDHSLHAPVPEESKQYLLSHCLPNDDVTLDQPPSVTCGDDSWSIKRHHFVNCRASGSSTSPQCKNFCENVALSTAGNQAIFGSVANCHAALDANPPPNPDNYTRDCHDPDSDRHQRINADLDRVKHIARQNVSGASGTMVAH
jgi:hypothetical protein